MTENQREELERRFGFHSLGDDQTKRSEQLRIEAAHLAFLVAELTSPSREQSLALTSIEDALMWANKAIAVNEVRK